MVVGIGLIVIRIEGCRSLKEKRRVVKSMIARLGNAFNLSIAEVGANDVHQRAEIGFAVVGNDRGVINSKVDKIFNMAEDLSVAQVLETKMEIFSI
jgi:uncharacterized protein YlxP (DUF503 family)